MLTLRDVHTFYGKSHILHGVSIDVSPGEIVGLLGRNGVGKSTTLKTIMGLVYPRQGKVLLEGRPVTALPAHKIAKLGIAYVPEDRRIFRLLTVLENLRTGLDRLGVTDARKQELLDKVFAYFPVLGERRNQSAGVLSGGEQQMLAIGRAMMSRPKLLMLDEPSMGLSPIMMQRIFTVIGELQEQGTTILLVEQNAQAALKLADKGYVLEVGSIVLDGTGQELLASDDVRKAYLGED